MRGRPAQVESPRHNKNQEGYDYSETQENSDGDHDDETRMTQRQMRAGNNEGKMANHVKFLQHHAPSRTPLTAQRTRHGIAHKRP